MRFVVVVVVVLGAPLAAPFMVGGLAGSSARRAEATCAAEAASNAIPPEKLADAWKRDEKVRQVVPYARVRPSRRALCLTFAPRGVLCSARRPRSWPTCSRAAPSTCWASAPRKLQSVACCPGGCRGTGATM